MLNILSVTLEIMFMFVLFESVRLDACGEVCVCVGGVFVCFQAEQVIGLSVNHPKASQGLAPCPLAWMLTVENNASQSESLNSCHGR